ncbi:EamA family transporter [Brevundimonas sp. 2R-24]|uniref:EamA family transporter n=1 Tax=Peiella sedimenti TaxID=3061083 RepID=A0ABT8SKU2_9CAUL|nr:EamA family transporter [Caulobacteraceae bacterium XZ-24]
MKLSANASAVLAMLACSVIWGTTWYAITLQLGVVDPVASIVYRFGLAAAILFAGLLLFRQKIRLTKAQHLAVAGQGLFTFAIDYAFVYWAEERVASAVVAVIFASLALLNLIAFRLALGRKAPWLAWGGALLGVAGVAVLSRAELANADFDREAATGVGLALIAVAGAAIGNLCAWRSQQLGAPVAPATAWAMAYGTGMLALYGLITGIEWRFETSWSYVLSLLHLSILGSVVAFVLYFGLARSRGYALASYISALTPPVAMLMSVAFEGASFGLLALSGLVLVLGGQLLLARAPKTA